MADTSRKDIATLFADVTLIERALRSGVRTAILAHKAAGRSVVVWRDNRIVWIPPEEIDIPEDDDGDEL